MNLSLVIPAKAGTQSHLSGWVPACAGMTIWGLMAALLLLLSAPAAAQNFPELGGKAVVDQAGLLSPQQVAELNAKSDALFKETGRPFVVATVKSLEGLTVEDYGYRLGRHWGLGGKEEDDGVILLVAPKEQKVRIETGYGAEGILPDIVGGRIIRDTIIPRFKANDMAGGIIAGANAIDAQLRLSPEEVRRQLDQASAEQRAREVDIPLVPIIFMVIVFFVIIGSIARVAGGRRYYGHYGGKGGKGGKRRRGLDSGDVAVMLWGLEALSHVARRGGGGGGWGGGGGFGGFGGGGGGGFGGFGGGSFGGGGASGSW